MEIEVAASGFPNEPILPADFSIPSLPFLTTASVHELEQYHQYKAEHIVIIGQGGSVNSIRALAKSLPATAQIHIVDSQDPYLLKSVKERVKNSCLIMPISKSGDTLSVLQATAYFNGLPMLVMTGASGSLAEMARRLQVPIVSHPPVGGRFIGNTSACLLAAYLAGMDVGSIIAGAQRCYASAMEKDMRINKALYVAALLFEAELRGYSDVFMPIYDCRLAGTKELIMQLCHETYGKQGKGHTVLALDAPESQHHTNQRYFGGPQNMVGAFISAQHGDLPSTIFIPEQAWGVPINGKILGLLHGVPHLTALHAELTGVLTHAKERDMPYVHLVVDRVDAHHVGYFTAFWQLVAVYGAVLRGVNPFDQPEVEHAKQVTRQLLL